MAFRVRTTTKAKRDLDDILERLLSQEAGETGLRWFQGLRQAVATLADSPQRCALAPENAVFPFEVRKRTLYAAAMRRIRSLCSALFSAPIVNASSRLSDSA
jgi:plasmid stabilization system protein ParE